MNQNIPNMASTPSSLLNSARTAVLKATGIDQSKDILPTLNLPKCVVQYLTTKFESSDFFVNKDDLTPEEIDIGLYKAICTIDHSAVLLKIIDPASVTADEISTLNKWKDLQREGVQKCYSSFNEDGKVVYVLQYMRRADELIRQCRQHNKKLSENYLWAVLHQVSQHLKYFTENNLPYANIQPHKIGLLLEGKTVLQNGVLNHHDEITSAAENMIMDDDVPVGVYSPSEILNEEDRTEKTLTWQIGATIYELAALRPAYQVEDANDVFSSLGEIMEGNLPPALEGYSENLKDIICKCLSFEQDSRPSLSDLIAVAKDKHDESGDEAVKTLVN